MDKEKTFKMDIQKKRYNTQLAGEYFVAGELFRQGFFAYVSFGNAKSFDILVFSENEKKFARIEVKSSLDNYFTKKREPIYIEDHKFHFNIESLSKEIKNKNNLEYLNKFYVFVVLGDKDTGKPDFFVFKAMQIYNVMESKIKACINKQKKVSGRWDIKLSEIFKHKDNEKKNNWDCLREYLEE